MATISECRYRWLRVPATRLILLSQKLRRFFRLCGFNLIAPCQQYINKPPVGRPGLGVIARKNPSRFSRAEIFSVSCVRFRLARKKEVTERRRQKGFTTGRACTAIAFVFERLAAARVAGRSLAYRQFSRNFCK